MTIRGATNRISDHPVLGNDTRRATVRLSIDGKAIAALPGESIASALLAHGIRVSRTMPDSGSPRSTFCGIGRCPDCMMTVDGELNVRTCITAVRDGMVIETQKGLGDWKVRV